MTSTPSANVGVVGLAVMGSNLARNLASREGNTVAVLNRSRGRTGAGAFAATRAAEMPRRGTLLPGVREVLGALDARPGDVLAPDVLPEWLDRWGPSARPLLWSHGMYLTLASTLDVIKS